MKSCGLPQLEKICRMINELEERAERSASSNPVLLLSILYLISDDPQKGRIQLSRALGTSEQVVRNALMKLEEMGFLVIEGRKKNMVPELYEAFRCLLKERILSPVMVEGWESPILVGVFTDIGREISVKEALDIRDEIIAEGGSGAIIFSVRGKCVDIPGLSNTKEIKELIIGKAKIAKNGLYALVTTKYDYNDFSIFYGFIRKSCEILLKNQEPRTSP